MEKALPHTEAIEPAGGCAGELEDFDALVRQHRPRIFRFLLASLRDRESAENLA